jgi:hypothetical protein
MPSYETHAPNGYMGDPRRGAAMGRPTTGDLRTSAELAQEYAVASRRLTDALNLKENRPGDGYKARCWEAAAEGARQDKAELKALYIAAKAREAATHAPEVTLRKVGLDSGGYDSNGTYFGTNSAGCVLYWAATDDGSYDRTFRAADRNDAKAQVRETIPHARIR